MKIFVEIKKEINFIKMNMPKIFIVTTPPFILMKMIKKILNKLNLLGALDILKQILSSLKFIRLNILQVNNNLLI